MCCVCFLFFFKQKTADELRISDWSSDVCSSDLQRELAVQESKLSTVTTGAKGDVVLGYDGSGLRPPPSYPRTTMRWWSPFTCRSRSPLPRRLTILNIPP